MLSNIFRQQARRALATHFAPQLTRQYNTSLLTLSTAHNPVLLRRSFSISRSVLSTPIENTYEDAVQKTSNPQSNIVHIGNLPYSCDEEELRGLFAQYGDIQQVVIPVDPEGRSKGYGFVTFSEPEAAVKVVDSGAEEPFVLYERNLPVSFGRGPRIAPRTQQQRQRRGPGKPFKTVHISNYPLPGDEEPMRKLLQNFQDKILRISFMKDADGSPTEKMFIEFTDVATSQTVLEAFQDSELEGVTLRFWYAKDKREKFGTNTRRYSNEDAYDA